MDTGTNSPAISWDSGTAYDFFASLVILHDPGTFGLRPAWAAGMRQRIPSRDREILEALIGTIITSPPLRWLSTLPEPKTGPAALNRLGQLPPVEQVLALVNASPALTAVLQPVIARGSWDPEDLQQLRSYYHDAHGKKVTDKYLENKLNGWAAVNAKAPGLVGALQSYYDVFFADEEHRIRPALETALAAAKEKSAQLSVFNLLVALSQGVHFSQESLAEVKQLVLVPSFWASPFVFFDMGAQAIILFGARPPDVSLIPGEVVSDYLLNTLNALSDPTRLRILRYLASETLTPTQLAARLRLRLPTVTHHMKTIRAAGLVFVIQSSGKEVYYTLRSEGFEQGLQQLRQFIFDDGEAARPSDP